MRINIWLPFLLSSWLLLEARVAIAASACGEEKPLTQTPTWAVAGVCAVIIIISLLLEKVLHKVGTVCFFSFFLLVVFCFSFSFFLFELPLLIGFCIFLSHNLVVTFGCSLNFFSQLIAGKLVGELFTGFGSFFSF